MSKFGRKLISAAAAAGICVLALTGCSSVNQNKTIATVNDTKITLGEAAFYLRYLQVGTESMFAGLFGQANVWDQDLFGTGEVYGDSLKSQVIGQLEEAVLMEQHAADYGVELTADDEAAIDEAVQAFFDANDKATLKAMYADEASVKRVLTLLTIHEKMEAAIMAEADTNVTDEEAAQKSIEYAYFSAAPTTDEDGNSVELTDEEKAAVKQQAVDVIAAVKGGKSLEDAVKEVDEEKTVVNNSYGADDSVLSTELKEAADALSDGEVCEEPVEIANGWYVVRMISTFDEEATQERKEEIVEERRSDHLSEVVEGWAPDDIGLDRDLWSKITFNVTFYKETEAQTEAGSEAVTEAGTEAGSEAVTEAGTEAGSEAATEAGTEAGSEAVTEAGTEAGSEATTEA